MRSMWAEPRHPQQSGHRQSGQTFLLCSSLRPGRDGSAYQKHLKSGFTFLSGTIKQKRVIPLLNSFQEHMPARGLQEEHMGQSEEQRTIKAPGSPPFKKDQPPLVITVNWDGNDRIIADTLFHYQMPMAADMAGITSGTYPSPLDLFVSALGGCPSLEILSIVNEKKKVITSLSVKVEGVRRKTLPTTFEQIHVIFTIGGDIDDDYAREVIHEVMTLRCPVAVTFGKATRLTWEHCILSGSAL